MPVYGQFWCLWTFFRRSEIVNLSRDRIFLVRSWKSTARAAEWRSPLGCARFRSVGVACQSFSLLVYLDFLETLRRSLVGSWEADPTTVRLADHRRPRAGGSGSRARCLASGGLAVFYAHAPRPRVVSLRREALATDCRSSRGFSWSVRTVFSFRLGWGNGGCMSAPSLPLHVSSAPRSLTPPPLCRARNVVDVAMCLVPCAIHPGGVLAHPPMENGHSCPLFLLHTGQGSVRAPGS